MSKIGSRRRRALATAALVALIVAVPLGVYAWGRTSGTFRVRHIVVSGARPAHARAVRGVLRRGFLGTNLFTVTAARVRAALVGFPYVDRVAIDRDFPGTLKVRMTEYVPAALLLSGGRWYVVSTEGRVLAEAAAPVPGASPSSAAQGSSAVSPSSSPSPAGQSSASPSGRASPAASPSPSSSSTSLPQPAASVALPRGTRHLPVIVSDAPLAVGGTVADVYARDALTVLAALPATLRRGALGASATATSIRVYVTGGPTVEFGDTTRLTAKTLALSAVLVRYRARHVVCTFVDVSVPDRPLGAPLLSAPPVQAATPTTAPSGSTTNGATGTPKSAATGPPTSKP
jgi:hypothetical protein